MKHRARKHRLLSWILILFASEAELVGQTHKPPTIATAEQVLAIANNPNATSAERNRVPQALDKLEPLARQDVIRKLISSPNLDLAGLAARRAINANDTEVLSAILAQVRSWSTFDRLEALQALMPGREAFVPIARALAEDMLSSNQSAAQRKPIVQALAPVLGRTGSSDDRALLLKLTTVYPESPNTWMAVAFSGAMDIQHTDLASKMYHDETRPLLLRVAAACALQSYDRRAAEFAMSQVNAVLSRLSGRTFGSMQTEVTRPKPPSPDADTDYKYFVFNFQLTTALAVLKTKDIERVVFEHIGVANEAVRGFCGLVAAARWPERLLKLGRGSFTDEEYPVLVAFIAMKHPKLRAEAEALITPEQMQRSTDRISRLGPMPLSWGDPTLLY